MLIASPQNVTITWNKGVRLSLHTYLYPNTEQVPGKGYWGEPINGDKPLVVPIFIYGTDTPTVEVKNPALGNVAGAADAINDWVGRHGFIEMWEQEAASYKTIMSSVHLPGLTLVEGRDYADFSTSLHPEGDIYIPTLKVTIRVCKVFTPWVSWEMPTGEYCDGVEVMLRLCDYDLDYPITMDKVKASLRPILQKYLDCLL